jgi:hypothetical protein
MQKKCYKGSRVGGSLPKPLLKSANLTAISFRITGKPKMQDRGRRIMGGEGKAIDRLDDDLIDGILSSSPEAIAPGEGLF